MALLRLKPRLPRLDPSCGQVQLGRSDTPAKHTGRKVHGKKSHTNLGMSSGLNSTPHSHPHRASECDFIDHRTLGGVYC